MMLFNLTAVPLSFLAFYFLFFPEKVETAPVLRALSRGLLLGVFGMLIKWLFLFRQEFSYSFTSVFYYTFLTYGGLSITAAFLLDTLIRALKKDSSKLYRLREFSLQWGITFTVLALFDTLYTHAVTGVLEPFILPFTRMGALFFLFLFTERFQRVQSSGKVLFAFLILLNIFISTLIQSLSFYHQTLLQIFLTILYFTASLSALFFEWKGKFFYAYSL